MKYVWIIKYHNQRGFIVKTAYFTSKRKAETFAKKAPMPKTAIKYEIYQAELI